MQTLKMQSYEMHEYYHADHGLCAHADQRTIFRRLFRNNEKSPTIRPSEKVQLASFIHNNDLRFMARMNTGSGGEDRQMHNDLGLACPCLCCNACTIC